MLCLEDIKIEFKSQGFKAIQFGVSPTGEETVLMMESIERTADQRCSYSLPAPTRAAACASPALPCRRENR